MWQYLALGVCIIGGVAYFLLTAPDWKAALTEIARIAFAMGLLAYLIK